MQAVCCTIPEMVVDSRVGRYAENGRVILNCTTHASAVDLNRTAGYVPILTRRAQLMRSWDEGRTDVELQRARSRNGCGGRVWIGVAIAKMIVDVWLAFTSSLHAWVDLVLLS